MATFAGRAHIDNSVQYAVGFRSFPNALIPYGGWGAALPTPVGKFGRLYFTIDDITDEINPVEARVPSPGSIIAVHVNTQRAPRGEGGRDANLGKCPIDGMGVGFDWFENIHVEPQRLDLGNVVSNLVESVELYSAYRIDDRIWSAFTNNAGAGITVLNLPTLPTTINQQSSFNASVQISPSGPPTINGTLDFVFDVTSVSVPITGTRIILFGLPPAGGAIKEKLSWLTDVMKAADGTEQRVSVRTYPRQEISFEALTATDFSRNQLNAFMFDWHSRVFGVPLWWDARLMTADVPIGATAISVTSTDNADFRAGGLAVAISFDADGNRTADTLEISTVSSSPAQVTFSSGTGNAYTAGQALLVPVVPGVLNNGVKKVRFPSTAQKTKVSFTSLDNDTTSIAQSLSGFSIHNSKAVIDDKNVVDRQLSEGFTQKITRIDGDTGEILQSSTEDRSTPTTQKRWSIETAARMWEIKSLLFALRGQQASFYLPTFNKDANLLLDVGLGGSTLRIDNIGYTQFIKTKEPFTTLAVRLVDNPTGITVTSPEVAVGSPEYWQPGQKWIFFDIQSSIEISSTVEELTVAPASPIGFTVADVDRIEFMVKSRFATDSVELMHKWTDALGESIDSEVTIPVMGAYDV